MPYIERADVVLSPKVIINKTVVINCPAGGIPLPEIVWQKNGENLDPVLHPNIQVMSGGRQLRITSAAISDSGRYRCIATNKAGNDNLDFQLSVHSESDICEIQRYLVTPTEEHFPDMYWEWIIDPGSSDLLIGCLYYFGVGRFHRVFVICRPGKFNVISFSKVHFSCHYYLLENFLGTTFE